MNKDLPEDNLEKFFQRELEDYGDEPSGDFWDKMEEKIPDKPNRFRAIYYRNWLSVAAALLLFIFSFVFYNYNKKLNHLAEKNKSQQEIIDQLKEELTEKQKSKNIIKEDVIEEKPEIFQVEKLNSTPENKIAQSEKSIHIANVGNKKSYSNNEIISDGDSGSPSFGAENNLISANKFFEGKTIPLPNSNNNKTNNIYKNSKPNKTNPPKTPSKKSFTAFGKLPTLDSKLPVSKEVFNSNFSKINYNKKTNKRKWQLGIQAGIFAHNRSAFPKGEKSGFYAERTRRIGGNVRYNLNDHIYIKSGLQSNNLNIYEKFINELSYDPNKENPEPDQSVGDYSFSLASPNTGTEEISVKVSRPNMNQIPEGEKFELDAVLHSNMKFISVPFTLGYHKKLGNWNLGAGAGVAGNYLNEYTRTFEFSIHHPKLKLKEKRKDLGTVRKILPESGYKRWHWEGLAQVELGYSVSPNWSISLMPEARWSLSKIHEKGEGNGLQYGTTVGLNCHF